MLRTIRLPLLAIVVPLICAGVLAYASRNSTGTYSLPAGNPVVSHTSISTTWANGTLSDVGTELTNSLDRNGRGAMLAPLPLSSGTVTSPALTFSSEPGSGIYRVGSNDIGISIGQSKRADFTASGVSINGTLGVGGATTLSSTLGVTGAATLSSTLNVSSTITAPTLKATTQVLVGTTNPGQWATNGSDIFLNTGTTASAIWLRPNGNSSAVRQALFDTTTGATFFDSTGANPLSIAADNPASTVPKKDTLTRKNILKAWAHLSGPAPFTVGDGFNIASTSCAGNLLTITFAQAMGNSNYAATWTWEDTLGAASFLTENGRTASSITLQLRNASWVTQNICTLLFTLDLQVVGAQ